MKEPLVSIALATYNGAKYFEKQINSLLQQTYKNLEIVISDDNSNDSTVYYIHNYLKRDNRIKAIFGEKRVGFLKNFERAIKNCNGEYIALCDQDDIWEKNKIEKQIKFIGSYDLVASDCALIDDHEQNLAHSHRLYQGINIPSKEDMFRSLVFHNSFNGCTMLFKRQFINTILPIPPEALFHDWWIAINAAIRNGISYITEPLVLYRKHNENVIGAHQDENENILSIFSIERRLKLRRQFSEFAERIKSYIDYGVYRNEDDKRLLEYAMQYYRDYLKLNTRWKTVVKGFKLKKYLYYNKSALKTMLYLLAKLF